MQTEQGEAPGFGSLMSRWAPAPSQEDIGELCRVQNKAIIFRRMPVHFSKAAGSGKPQSDCEHRAPRLMAGNQMGSEARPEDADKDQPLFLGK